MIEADEGRSWRRGQNHPAPLIHWSHALWVTPLLL